MKARRLFFFSLIAIVLIASAGTPTKSQFLQTNGDGEGLIAGRNVNMVGGTDPVTEDPYDTGLQRQNEPSIAVSARNPMHLIAAANDWRPVAMDVVGEELPGVHQGLPATDAWMGIYKSINGGESFYCEFLPGSPVEVNEYNSPIYGYNAVADPVLASGGGGLVVGGAITFNRGQRGEGALFAFRYLDRNNQEAGDPWIHVDQQILDLGDPGHFIDKEWVIVDRPRTTEMVQLPTLDWVPKFNVFIVYTSFMGETEVDAHGKLMLTVSHDSGNTWTKPTQITDAGMPYQAACMTIDQRNGRLHIAYRRFARDGYTDAIMLLSQKPPNKYDEEIGYTHENIKFAKPVVVAEINPFDQATTPTTFRTNTYPSITSDHKGRLYIVDAERNEQNYSEILLRIHNPDTGEWGGPFILGGEDDYPYAGDPGHKFQPMICYNQGYITAVWLDSRYDESVINHGNPHGYGYYVQKDFMPFRRTIDVRAIQFEPFDIGDNPTFPQSIQVSKYPWLFLFDDQGWPEEAVQLLNFKPNLELFAQNSSAFIGDYIGLTGAAHFVPDGNGGWKYNTERVENPVFHAAWADNRDVLNLDNLLNFKLPGASDCVANATGTRNQNVYTSRLTRGIIAGSPGNTKPLNIKRAFVILIRNTTEFARTLHLTIDAPAGVDAKFRETGLDETPTADITVLPYSSYAATVVVYPNDDEYASVTVQVWEGGVLLSEVVLNPDRYTPWIEEPEVDYTTPHVAADNEIHTPHVAAYQIIQWSAEDANPHVAAPHVAAPHVAALSINDDIVAPHVAAPHVAAYSPDVLNPHVAATHVDNLYGDSDITDVSIDVENRGNTTSAYAVSSLPANLPEGVLAQLLVYRVHITTSAHGCDLVLEEHHELLVNSLNPHVAAPHVAAVTPELSFRTGTAEPSEFVDAKFALKPQEKAIVVYRFIDKHTEDDEVFYPEVIELEFSPDTPDIKDGYEQPYVSLPLIIETSARLPNGTVGVDYPTVQLVASGGIPPYDWSVAPNSDPLPGWLALDANGLLHATQNTPQADGPYEFRIQVTDSFGVLPDEHATSSKDFYITVLPDNSIEISGWAREVGGTGLEEVAIEFSGRAGVALTDASGFYSHRVPYDWTGTSKAYLRGYYAEPAQRTYANLTADVANQDFTLYLLNEHVMISGVVTEDIGGTPTPVEGVVINFSDGQSETTDANGYYSHFVSSGWTGTATPSLDGYSFTPPSETYDNIVTNQVTDYTATQLGGLVAYYPFNGNANDESGNGNHGTVLGATLVEDLQGNPNSAYYFDGIDDVITAQERNFVANNSFSISLLVKVPGPTATSYFIEGNGFGVWQSGVNIGLAIHLPSTSSAGGAVTSGRWQHFVGTYDGNTIRAYINGSLVGETPWPGTPGDSDWLLMFGGRNDGVSFWEGYLDEVRIYNTVLDITEIEALFGTYVGKASVRCASANGGFYVDWQNFIVLNQGESAEINVNIQGSTVSLWSCGWEPPDDCRMIDYTVFPGENWVIFPVNPEPRIILIKEIPSPGSYPEGLAWDGTFLWNSDFGTSSVYKLNPNDGSVLASFPTPQPLPNGLTYDGTHLWLAIDSGDNKIYEINPSDGSVINSYDTPSTYPQGLTWDGQNLWNSDINEGLIYKLNPSNGAVVSYIPTPGAQPYGLAWDGTYLWHVDFDTDMIYQLNPLDGSVLYSTPSPGPEPRGLTSDGQYLWCTDNSTGSIYQISLQDIGSS